MNVKHIAEGWVKLVGTELKLIEVDPVARKRYAICAAPCKHFNEATRVCKLCSCYMPAKVLVSGAMCPNIPVLWQ
jgi:hypothetical protein